MCYYVDVGIQNREKFINYFEQRGFIFVEGFYKKDIVERCLAIVLDFETKRIRMLNVTCACVASWHGLIKKEGEFMKMIGGNL